MSEKKVPCAITIRAISTFVFFGSPMGPQLPKHTKVLMALIVMTQGTFFVAHSLADIETLVDKKKFDMIVMRL